jgi:hypothetical protein
MGSGGKAVHSNRKASGKNVKRDEHLMDVTRYLIVSGAAADAASARVGAPAAIRASLPRTGCLDAVRQGMFAPQWVSFW